MGAGVLPLSLKGYEVRPHTVPHTYSCSPRSSAATTVARRLPPQIEPGGEETLANLEEYAVASALFYTLLETTACETSQRVTAMDNASTNAKDMVDRFKLIYNRARQAKITTELTEIISGAESVQVSGASD